MSHAIDERDERGMSELHRAAEAGDSDACRDMLHAGADPNLRTGVLVRDGPLHSDSYWEPGYTPLLLALENGHSEVAELLMDLGAEASAADPTSWGVLHAAVVGDLPELVVGLVRAGADPNLESSRRSFDEELGWFFVNTPLHVAALENHMVAAQRLIESGADLTTCWRDRRTPLFYAAARGNTELVEFLCASGADPNLREHRHERDYFLDMAPLHYAGRNGHRQTYEALVRVGAEPRARDSYTGMTAAEMIAEAQGARLDL